MDFIRKGATKVTPVSVFSFSFFLMLSAPLKAAEWSISPAVGVAGESGNNAALIAGAKDSYWRLLAIPSLNIVRQDRNSELSLHTFLDFKYSQNDKLSDQSQRIYLRYAYVAERHKLGVKGILKREGVLRNITAEVDPDDVTGSDLDGADTSVLSVSFRRTILDIKPYWSWKLSERDTLKLQYRLADTGYSTDDFSDQRRHTLSANLSHRLTEKLDAVLNLSGSQFNNLDSKSSVDNRQINLGVNYKFSDQFTGQGQIGFRDSTTGLVDSSGVIYQITGNKRTEVGSLNILVRRNVGSSAKDTTTLADELKVWWKKRVRPAVDFSLYLNTYRNKALSDDSSSQVYFGVQPRLTWRLSLKWSVDFNYEIRQLKDNENATAKSNSVAMGVSYAWPKSSLSR